MTDSKMPERIWAWKEEATDRDNRPYTRAKWEDDDSDTAWFAERGIKLVEYIRADLAHPAPVADAELEAALAAQGAVTVKPLVDAETVVAEICHDEQMQVWASELLMDLAGSLSFATYDDKVAAFMAVRDNMRLALEHLAAALIARTAQPVGVQWQPIETAPHEELVVLGWQEDGVWKQEIALASAGERLQNGYSNRWLHGRATHWMPLPAAPALLPDGGAHG